MSGLAPAPPSEIIRFASPQPHIVMKSETGVAIRTSSSRSSTRRSCCPLSGRVGRGAAAAGDLGAQRSAQEHDVPPAVHARALRYGGQGQREPLPVVDPAAPAAVRSVSATPPRAPTTSSPSRSRRGWTARPTTEGIELIAVDNRYNPKTAQRNADVLVREKVDLVIEFQTDEHVALMVAAKYREAGIPLIAIEIPHPGATYFGANNYEAGVMGGRYLGRWAKHYWHAEADEILLIAARARRQPAEDAADRHVVGHEGDLSSSRATAGSSIWTATGSFGRQLRGDAPAPAREPVASHSRRRHQRPERARRAAGVSGVRADETCAIMGQNASPEGREELRQRGTRLVGSVAYFPEKYGAELIALATGYPASPSRAARGLRQAPARDAGDRQSGLSERSTDEARRRHSGLVSV